MRESGGVGPRSIGMRYAVALAALLLQVETKPQEAPDLKSFLGKAPPELVSEKGDWVNASDAVTLAKLKGKVVWLEFTTIF